MFTLTSTEKYYLYSAAVDMRNGFNGLSGIVNNILGRLPELREVYIFINKQKNKMKLLHYESGGFTVYYKRLEAGRFEHKLSAPNFDQINWSKLILIVEGIIIEKSKQKKRYLLQKS